MGTGTLLALAAMGVSGWVLGVRWAARALAERKWAQSDHALDTELLGKRARLDAAQKAQGYEPQRRRETDERRRHADRLRTQANIVDSSPTMDDAHSTARRIM